MSDELIKKLTGKNKADYEEAASHLVNFCDVEMFDALVEKEDFLFDFIKANAAERITNAVNENNYKNLLCFLKRHSSSYEDAIVSLLVKYADEDLTDEMLEKLENGTSDEKTYCAKFFTFIQDPLAIEFLKENTETENESLNFNSAAALGAMKEESSYNNAIERLNSEDEFEKLSAVKFLVAYSDRKALPLVIIAMKNSTMSENIAGEIPYLESIFKILDENLEDGLLIINNIINGIGEIIPISAVFDYELFEVFEKLISKSNNSKTAIVLLNAEDKFETLTENDEYLFDEAKETQKEVQEIKKLLSHVDKKELKKYVNQELDENSPFVYTALDFADDILTIRELLKCSNQTIILKTAEVLKGHNSLDYTTKTIALVKITDENIKAIIRAL